MEDIEAKAYLLLGLRLFVRLGIKEESQRVALSLIAGTKNVLFDSCEETAFMTYPVPSQATTT